MGSSLTKFAVAAATVQFGIVSAFAPAMRSISRNTVAVGEGPLVVEPRDVDDEARADGRVRDGVRQRGTTRVRLVLHVAREGRHGRAVPSRR